MTSYRDYGGSTSRYANRGPARAFSIPDADFQRGDTTLKRRRHLSPSRPIASLHTKSKSHARIMSHKMTSQELLVPLGSNRTVTAYNRLHTNTKSYHRPSGGRGRSRSPRQWEPRSKSIAPKRSNPSPISTRTRSKSSTREKKRDTRSSRRERSSSVTRRSGGGASLGSRKELETSLSTSSRTMESRRKHLKHKMQERERERSLSRTRSSRCSRIVNSSDEQENVSRYSSRSGRCSSQSGSSLAEIESAIADTEQELKPKKKELDELKKQLAKLRKRVEAKELEVYDLQVDLDALRKRRERRLPSHSTASTRDKKSLKRSRSKSKRRESERSSSRSRTSKRPCIVDEDDEGSDDDGTDDEVVILDPSEVKMERERSAAVPKSAVVPVEDSMPDHFWGRSPTPKLLANHRFRAIPDGSARKGRHLAFNPIQPQIFATSPDEGGLILWSYQRQDQDIAKVVTLMPSSFREGSPCAEAISWSPDGNRMAMAFRDPVNEKGEFCIVQLHQLKLEDSRTSQSLPGNRITSKCTTLHPRGISTIDWLPSDNGPETTSRQLITTGNSDHAVVLWEEHENRQNGGLDLKWTVLHRDHRSEVKSLCVHSKRDCLYTGGLDGLLVRYDLNKGRTETVLERRKPNISKINSVLEHPHNPNLLLVSCVEQTRHSLLLHDLRQRYDGNEMSLTWESGAMSQYVVPRWSPAGYHVSCGSKTGVVNIWDVRMRGDKFPTVEPQQALRVHHKTVLHATWHPRYDAMFSVSHDRTIGLLTFR
ncbi:unnamed protein product [Peronospora farinosa]|uniref:Uncharacterized protein n=1 Tax=Peronospora farinosa TaxID=134698 RepID=A0AAV0T0X7_9STRA|nr:unnamed protein product [Peronospora farinosa]